MKKEMGTVVGVVVVLLGMVMTTTPTITMGYIELPGPAPNGLENDIMTGVGYGYLGNTTTGKVKVYVTSNTTMDMLWQNATQKMVVSATGFYMNGTITKERFEQDLHLISQMRKMLHEPNYFNPQVQPMLEHHNETGGIRPQSEPPPQVGLFLIQRFLPFPRTNMSILIPQGNETQTNQTH
jgi:hypothetical protein